MRVLVIEVVLADVNYGQLPELRHIHHFVEHALSQCTFAEEAHTEPPIAQALGGECGAGSDSSAAGHYCVCAQVAGSRVGDMHRATFAAAVSRLLAQQLGK